MWSVFGRDGFATQESLTCLSELSMKEELRDYKLTREPKSTKSG